jgi:hypothetical protein
MKMIIIVQEEVPVWEDNPVLRADAADVTVTGNFIFNRIFKTIKAYEKSENQYK